MGRRRVFPFCQIFRKAVGAVAACANCWDLLLFVPIVKCVGVAVKMTFPEFETHTDFGPLSREATPTDKQKRRRGNERKDGQLTTMRNHTHGSLFPVCGQVTSDNRDESSAGSPHFDGSGIAPMKPCDRQ